MTAALRGALPTARHCLSPSASWPSIRRAQRNPRVGLVSSSIPARPPPPLLASHRAAPLTTGRRSLSSVLAFGSAATLCALAPAPRRLHDHSPESTSPHQSRPNGR